MSFSSNFHNFLQLILTLQQQLKGLMMNKLKLMSSSMTKNVFIDCPITDCQEHLSCQWYETKGMNPQSHTWAVYIPHKYWTEVHNTIRELRNKVSRSAHIWKPSHTASLRYDGWWNAIFWNMVMTCITSNMEYMISGHWLTWKRMFYFPQSYAAWKVGWKV